jgi:hypothetical protein
MTNFEDITLSPSQQNVVDSFPGFLLSKDKEFTISGYAGSGKTFLVQYLTKMAPAQQKMVQLLDPSIKARKFIYTATTNKAAEVLRGTLHQPTATIHATLGLRVMNDYTTGKQTLQQKDPSQPLSSSILFIDEASMINNELLESIRKTAKNYTDCKIVYIGDAYQLPPVKEDVCPIFQAGKANTHFLREIQRQAEDSPIISLASEYRKMLDDPSLSWPEIPQDNESIFWYDDKAKYFDALRTAYTAPHKPDDLKIVAWKNNRVIRYNSWIRNLLGFTEPIEPGDIVTTNKPMFNRRAIVAPTDYRMTVSTVTPGVDVIANRYEVTGYWVTFTKWGNTVKVFMPSNWNDVDVLTKQLAKEKDWGPFFSIKENWADLRPIHASTVHKAQGSTYKEVFVDLDDIGKNTRWRDVVRLVYVAVTRASHKVHIYGNVTTNHVKKEAVDSMESFKDVQSLLQF